MLVPKEMQSEHKGGIKAMTDQQIEAAIEMIEGIAEPVSEPGPRRKAERFADRTLSEAQPDSDNAPVSMLAEPSTS